MADLIMIKRLGALRPADDASEELMNSLPLGEPIKVKISRPRNLQQHRKFYALLQIVFSNQSIYPTIDALLAVIKITLGHCDIVKLPNGDLAPVVKSISFASMPQDDFNRFYSQTVDLVLQHFLAGIEKTELEREIFQLIGVVR
jgi:hypothetical protein